MDTTSLPDVLVYGMPVAVLAPIIVEQEKKLGLPVEWTGVASILTCLVLLGFAGFVTGQLSPDNAVKYLAASLAYGLAGNGLYSQTRMLTGNG
jgi:hypothetical protein